MAEDAGAKQHGGGDAFARPKTSTRDRGELRDRLERWLAARLGREAAPEVSPLDGPSTNGMSSETLLFELAWDEGGARRRERLVARVAPDPGAVPVFPEYDMDRQFRVMRDVAAQGVVPVPRVRWSEPDPAPLGAPFFVMERVDGRVPPDIMPYTFESWLSEASRADQARLQEASVALVAALAAIERPEERFGFLRARPGETALREHVLGQRAYYEWVAADGLRSPLLERAFAALEQRWPRHESATVLSWGDARIGNVLYEGFDPVAVLDWEMAALAPPEVDLAWMIALHRFFQDLAERFGKPGIPHLLRPDDVAASFERRTGRAPRDLDFYLLYAALRHGIVMFRIGRRSLRFGEAKLPDDVDDLIPHRAMIERMLDGSYWGAA
ncbi:MAG TPA: phosphotransferase family protein [Myxococcota bacterium]|nr:phosphotransferase family protein [Myxococcota bacterium]